MVNTLFKGRLSRMSSTGAAATIPKTVEVKSVSHGMNVFLSRHKVQSKLTGQCQDDFTKESQYILNSGKSYRICF